MIGLFCGKFPSVLQTVHCPVYCTVFLSWSCKFGSCRRDTIVKEKNPTSEIKPFWYLYRDVLTQGRQSTYNITMRRVRVLIAAVKHITYSECVSVALFIQHVMRMRHVIFISVACASLPYFSRLRHKWYNFRRKVIHHKMFVLILF